MDIISDNSKRTLHKLAAELEFPDYVRSHQLMDKQAAATLSPGEFADDSKGAFPICSKADTWLSAAYFSETSGGAYKEAYYRNYVEGRIRDAASVWGISNEVDEILGRSIEKEAAAIFTGLPDGSFPMRHAEEVKQAMAFYRENRNDYSYEDRFTITSNICKAASAYGVATDDLVARDSGNLIPSRKQLTAELEYRLGQPLGDAEKKAYADITESVKKLPYDSFVQSFTKIACMIDDLDLTSGLKARGLVDDLNNVRVLQPRTEKKANEKKTFEINGNVIDAAALASLGSDFLAPLGDDFVEDVSSDGTVDPDKLCKIVPTLPKPDLDLLLQLMQDYSGGGDEDDEASDEDCDERDCD